MKSTWIKSVHLVLTVAMVLSFFASATVTASSPQAGADRVMREARRPLGSVQQDGQRIEIRLDRAVFDPLDGMPDLPANLRTSQYRNGAGYYLVQLRGPVLTSWRARLEESGAVLMDYVPEFTYIARMDNAALARVRALHFVRWVGHYDPAFRLSTSLDPVIAAAGPADVARIVVRSFTGEPADALAQQMRALGATVLDRGSESGGGVIFKLELPATAIPAVASLGGVAWVEPLAEPRLTNAVARSALALNQDAVEAELGLYGAGQVIVVGDTGVSTGVTTTMHADFQGHFYKGTWGSGTCGSWSDYYSHGTHVAGSALGNGVMDGSNPATHSYAGTNAGIAPEASLWAWAFCSDWSGLPDADPYNNYYGVMYNDAPNVRVNTNSWGYNTTAGTYNAYSRETDRFIRDHPDMVVLFAATNDGTDANADGIIDLGSIGVPAGAKNIITVGASENYRMSGGYNPGGDCSTWGNCWPGDYPAHPIASDRLSDDTSGMVAFSSRGPTLSGRLKPDIVAPGSNIVSCRYQGSNTGWGVYNDYYIYMGGTSMATPLAAGASAIVRDYYVTVEGVNPSAALVKATMINGAYDMTPGQYRDEVPDGSKDDVIRRPDNNQGWGRIDLYNTLVHDLPYMLWFYDDPTGLNTGGVYQTSFSVSGADHPFRVTLAWSDYPGTEASHGALVNDLDLEVIAPNGTHYYGNDVIDDGLNDGDIDHVNNVEGVDFNPQLGTYTVIVHGYNVPQGPQPFALVVSGDMGQVGYLDGTVTDGTLGGGLEGASIQAITGTVRYRLTTDASGYYTGPLAADTYTVSAWKYGYTLDTVTGVVIISGTITTQNFTLYQTNPYSLTGCVTDAATSAPLAATISVYGPFGDLITQTEAPQSSGCYALTLYGGPYTVRAEARLHNPGEAVVDLVGHTVQDFALTATTTDGILWGYITNLETGSPIEGATVAVTPGPYSTDSAADGYYELQLPNGLYTVTVSAPLFSTVQETDVPVPQSNLVRRDYALPTAHLEVDPAALEYTLELGQQITQTPGLTITNSGSGALDFELVERGGGFMPTLRSTARQMLQLAGPAAPDARQAPSQVGRSAPIRPASPADILLDEGFEGGVVPPAGWTEENTNAGYNWKVHTSDPHTGTYAADVEYDPDLNPQDEWLLSPELMLAEGTLSFWSFGSLHWCRDTYDNCDLNVWIVVDEVGGGDDIYVGKGDDVWPADWTWAQSVFDLTPLLPGGPVRIGFQYEGLDGAQVALDDIVLDGVEGGDALPWLTESPITGTVPPGNQALIDIGWWANVPEIDQPGIYYGGLRIKNNDPENQDLTLPVTMTVTAPTNWGKLEGVVTSLGYCDSNPAPAAGAEVYLEGSGGYTFTLFTEADGSYIRWLDASQSPYTVTVSYPEHATGVAVVNINGGVTTTANFDLRWLKPCLTPDPLAMEVAVELGAAVTQTLTLYNDGGSLASFEIRERDLGFTPLSPAAGEDFVVVRHDSTAADDIQAALTSLGYTFLAVTDAEFQAMTVDQLLEYDAVFHAGITGFSGAPGASELLIMAYLDAGGSLFIADNDLGYYRNGSTFYDTYLQASYVSDNPGIDTLIGEDIMAGLTLDITADPYPDDFTVRAEGVRIFQYQGGNAGGVAVERAGYRAIYLSHDFQNIADPADQQEVIARAVDFLAAGDVPWLSETPITGTVAADSSFNITVTFDAGVAEVSEPGVYRAEMTVHSNDPVNDKLVVPVTMTVAMPSTLGLLKGYVTSTGYCDVTYAPLAGADVLIESSGGMTWTRTTDDNGFFYAYIDAVYSPLTVTVSHPEHETGMAYPVAITAQQTTTVGFDLRWLGPCLSVDPLSFEVTLGQGSTANRVLTIDNSGGGAGSFELREREGGYSPLALMGGGPDPFGYTFLDSNEPGGPTFQWIDATDGTPLGLADDGEANVTLPFPFNFYGTSSTDLRVGNNGGVLFGVTTGDLWAGNDPLGSTDVNNVIAAFWDDIDSETGDVYYKTVGNPGSRQFIVEWYNRPHFSNTGAGTFQMILYEGTNNIKFQYLDLDFGDADYNYGASATVGIRQSGTNYLQYSYNQAVLADSFAICFQYPGSPPCDGGDVPWVSETPITGTVAADSSFNITVTFVTTPAMPLGTYTATLIANTSDTHNNHIEIPLTLHVIAEEPIAGLAAHNDSPTTLGETTTLSATITAGTNVTYEWDLGDSGTATGQTVMHVYPAVGTYTATVTATNSVSQAVAQTVVVIEYRHIYLPLVTRSYRP